MRGLFDLLIGFKPVQTIEEKRSEYENKLIETRPRNAAVSRVANTSPSHSLNEYAGTYQHVGYGRTRIRCGDQILSFERMLYEMNVDGEIAACSIRLELTVAPIHFVKKISS